MRRGVVVGEADDIALRVFEPAVVGGDHARLADRRNPQRLAAGAAQAFAQQRMGRGVVGTRDDDHFVGRTQLCIERCEAAREISRPAVGRNDD